MSTIQETLDKHPALKALGLEVCACGQPKKRKQYFCRACWRSLRWEYQTTLKLLYSFTESEEVYQRALDDLREKGKLVA